MAGDGLSADARGAETRRKRRKRCAKSVDFRRCGGFGGSGGGGGLFHVLADETNQVV